MVNFRTSIKFPDSDLKINHKSKILFLGSCFSENIGHRLSELKFTTQINPFGNIYNPKSVGKSLEFLMQKDQINADDLFYANDQWNSFNFHSRYSHPEKEKCLDIMNKNIQDGHELLKQADYLFLTFGTAFIYKLKETGKVVSNCHKLPKDKFETKLLSVNKIIDQYFSIINKLILINPRIKIVFTVSPVRYLKDGFNENQISKSTLLLAINELKNRFENVSYFPAYEIMMDDLRDYRFYDEDLVHPNNVAVNYIWEVFERIYFDENTLNLNKSITNIVKAKNHRPVNIKSESHKKFIQAQIKAINKIQKEHHYIDFSEEISHFS